MNRVTVSKLIVLSFVMILVFPVLASAQKLVVGYSGVTAISTPVWVIKEAGYLKQDGLEVRMYTLGFEERSDQYQKDIDSLGEVATLFAKIQDFRLDHERDADSESLNELVSSYRATVGNLLRQLNQLREWDMQDQKEHGFLFDAIEIELKQGDMYRRFHCLSFGQKCGIILKLVLRCEDTRVLILDQLEDHLDAYSIVRIIATTLRKLGEHRQVILATHNSTLVLAVNPDNLTVLESRGAKGGIHGQGSLSQREVVKEMLEILEGHEETFKLNRTFSEQPISP